MGSVSTSFFEPLSGERFGEGSEQGRPIGAAPTSLRATARRSRLESGVVVFGGEEPIELFPAVLRALTLADDRTHALLRYEVKSNPKGASPGPQSGEYLIVTERPYSNGWFVCQAFKRGSHRSADERQTVRAATIEAAQREIEQRATDPWESGALVTAALRPPNPIGVFDDPLRSAADSAWLFGVCEDRERYLNALLASSEARRLLQLASERRLRLGPNRLLLDASVAEEASATLFLAVNQALAGPRASNEFVGEPVIELAKLIFEEQLYNRMRRTGRESARTVNREDEH